MSLTDRTQHDDNNYEIVLEHCTHLKKENQDLVYSWKQNVTFENILIRINYPMNATVKILVTPRLKCNVKTHMF